MKKNLSLFVFLISLLVLTYFLQERRSEKNYQTSLVKGKLLKEEIKTLKLPYVEATKKDGRWFSGNQLLSHNTFKMLEKKLNQIKSIKDIVGNPKNFFTHSIRFDVNGQPWEIGDLSLDKQSFYISSLGKISLAIIEGESSQVSTQENEIQSDKLEELRHLLSKSLNDFKETQLFRFYPQLPLQKVLIQTDESPDYELVLNADTTLPPPINGISVHQDLRGKFQSVLTQMTLIEEISYDQKLKFKKMASMTFIDEEKKNVVWSLWLRSKDSADAIIIDDEQKRAFKMLGGTLKPFFIRVQDYWDKKVIPPKIFKAFEKLPVMFTQGTKEASVIVLDREPLDFESQKFKVKPGNMQDLFQLIFNLGAKDQADRISHLSKSEHKQYLSENPLKIELMGQEIICIRKKDEIILVNLTQGFKAHFWQPHEKLNCQFEDVLE
jgi:hypothetical protein